MPEKTFSETLSEIDGGIFLRQATEAIKQVALSAIETQKPGELILKLKIKPTNDSGAVNIESSLSTLEPKRKGRVRLDHMTVTPMYANKQGQLSVFIEAQADLFTQKQTS